MNLGTGKVPKDTSRNVRFPIYNLQSNSQSQIKKHYYSQRIRHHLIDVASPKRQFTVARFKKLGQKAIKGILKKEKTPIIVGGTGFYVDVLLNRINIPEVGPNIKLRKQFDKLTAEHLFKMLRKLDPRRAETIEPQNKRRLIRALEITTTKRRYSFSHDRGKNYTEEKYKILWLGIKIKQKKLDKKIEKRLNERLKQGMIKEVQQLHQGGVSWKRLDSFGLEYRQISEYLKNSKLQITNYKQITNSKLQILNFKKSEYYEKLLRDIIRYSKRQMTWFKRNKEIKWKNIADFKTIASSSK